MKKALFVCSIFLLFSCETDRQVENTETKVAKSTSDSIPVTEEQWRDFLDPMAFHVLREKGTERAFTGEFHDNHRKGKYFCKGCGQLLFYSDQKFDSGCGWPSFFEVASDSVLIYSEDLAYGMVRTEVQCKKCKGHLGHVFDDGPPPTGLRYCINSAALNFESAE